MKNHFLSPIMCACEHNETKRREITTKKKEKETFFGEVRDDSNGFRDALKPWVSPESILCCKHLLSLSLELVWKCRVLLGLSLL